MKKIILLSLLTFSLVACTNQSTNEPKESYQDKHVNTPVVNYQESPNSFQD